MADAVAGFDPAQLAGLPRCDGDGIAFSAELLDDVRAEVLMHDSGRPWRAAWMHGQMLARHGLPEWRRFRQAVRDMS